MSTRLITLLLLMGALIQTLLPVWNVSGSLEISVLTGLVIYTALHADQPRILYAAILAGLLHDALCPAPIGLSIPFFILITSGIRVIRKKVFGDQLVTYAVLGVLAAVFQTLYFALIFLLSGLRPVPAEFFALRLAGGLLTGLCTAPLVFLTVSRFRKPNRRYRV